MEDYIKITLNSALYNAGVLGVIKFLETAGAEENSDYRFEKQDLFIKREFLLNADLAEIYLDTMIKVFGEKSIVSEFIKTDFDNLKAETKEEPVKSENSEEAENLENKNGSSENENSENESVSNEKDDSEKNKKIKLLKLLNRYNSFLQYFKNSCDYFSLSEINDLGDKYAKINSQKFINDKINLAKKIQNILLNNQELKNYLIIIDLTTKEYKKYFTSFALKNSHGVPYKDFILRLNEIYFDIFKKFLTEDNQEFEEDCFNCIECDKVLKKQYKFNLNFVEGVVNDIQRKQSVFWNFKANIKLCPLCQFVYLCMPFGFNYNQKKLYFINDNCSIDCLLSTNVGEKTDIINNILNMFKYRNIKNTCRLSGLEVLIKGTTYGWKYYIMDSDMINILVECQTSFNNIKNVSIKFSKNIYFNLFEECFNNILLKHDQWQLIDNDFRLLLENKDKLKTRKITLFNLNFQTLFNLLIIQIKQDSLKEGFNMQNQSYFIARNAGNDLRRKIGDDADNKLISYIYKLINSLSCGNKENFLNSVVRMYGGMDLPIPNILINLFNDENFKIYGYAYLFGLKGCGDNNNQENNKENIENE